MSGAMAMPATRPAVRKTFVSNTPRDDHETLRSVRLLLKADRIEEAKDLIEYAYTKGYFR